MGLDIVLSKGQIVLQQTQSSVGIMPIGGDINVGLVISVYSTSDRITEGAKVLYEAKKAATVLYGSTMYLLIDEKYISSTESPPP